MALQETGATSSKYINLKFTKTADDKPAFVLQEDFKDTATSFKKVSWNLKSIRGSFTPKGGTNKYDTYGAKIELEDEGEVYVIDTTITNGSKDMLNGILSAKVGDRVVLDTYINGKGYVASAAIRDENLEWKEKYFPNFIAWSDEYKTNFKDMIFGELQKRGGGDNKPAAQEEVNLDSIPF